MQIALKKSSQRYCKQECQKKRPHINIDKILFERFCFLFEFDLDALQSTNKLMQCHVLTQNIMEFNWISGMTLSNCHDCYRCSEIGGRGRLNKNSWEKENVAAATTEITKNASSHCHMRQKQKITNVTIEFISTYRTPYTYIYSAPQDPAFHPLILVHPLLERWLIELPDILSIV